MATVAETPVGRGCGSVTDNRLFRMKLASHNTQEALRRIRWIAGSGWLLALLFAAFAFWSWQLQARDPSWPSYADTFTEVAPGVVNVSLESTETRVGSGFAISSDRVVTARHLVLATGELTVRDVGGRTLKAVVVGTDARTDLALLKVPGGEFTPAVLGESTHLRIGDTVLAIGNPYGLGHSLAVGVVGHRGRRLVREADGPRVDFIQLSIPLNPGNSGGPIFDVRGKVVGVLAGTHSEAQAIAFAVPIEVLLEGLPALEQGERVSRAFLGVRTEMAGDSVVVTSVIPSGPADKAGLRVGDVISTFDNVAIKTPWDLIIHLDRLAGGTRTTLRAYRNGELVVLDVALADWAEQPVVVAGMIVRPLPGTGGRVVAVRLRSRAERAGVREEDVIRSVNGVPVQAPAGVKTLLADGEAAQLGLVREGVPLMIQL